MTTSNVWSRNGISSASATTGNDPLASFSPAAFRSRTTIREAIRSVSASLTSHAPAATSRMRGLEIDGKKRSIARIPPSHRLTSVNSRYACANSCFGRLRSSMISSSWARLSNLTITEDQRRILGSEADAIRQRIAHPGLARNQGNVIEIALRVRVFEIQRRWNQAFAHGKQNGAQAGGAAGALRMSEHGLRRAHRNARSHFAKAAPDGSRFDAIVELGGRAVEIHIVDVAAPQACIFKRHLHGAGRLDAGFVQTHAMVRIACRTVSHDLRIDPRATRLRGFFGLDDINPCALAKHKPVAIGGKRSRALFRVVVPRLGQDSHQTEARKNSRRERRVRPAANDDVGASAHNSVAGVEQRVSGAGASGRNNVTRAVQLERHRNLAAQRADRRCRNRIDAGFLRLASKPVRVLPFRKFKSSPAAAEDHADSPALIQVKDLRIQPRILERLPGRNNSKSRRARNVGAFFRVKGLERVGVAYFSRNLNGKLRRIESGDPAYAASRATEPVPKLVPRVAQRSQTAETTNYNAIRTGVSTTYECHGKIIHLNPKVRSSSCR